MAFSPNPQIRLETALGEGAKLVCQLGVSCYAKVYLYYLPNQDCLQAIKLADPGDVMRSGDYNRFQLEVTILESQPHPGIVRMWNYGIPNYSDDVLDFPPWISLDLAPGGDLRDYLRREEQTTLYGNICDSLRRCFWPAGAPRKWMSPSGRETGEYYARRAMPSTDHGIPLYWVYIAREQRKARPYRKSSFSGAGDRRWEESEIYDEG
jgi:hypothetical protein